MGGAVVNVGVSELTGDPAVGPWRPVRLVIMSRLALVCGAHGGLSANVK